MATKGMTVFTHQGEDFTINDPNIAGEFASGNYKKGAHCYFQGNLYRFTSDHSGAWSGTDVERINVAEEIEKINGVPQIVEVMADTGRVTSILAGNASDWEVGGLNSDGSENDSDTSHIRTKYIDMENATEIHVSSSKQYWMFWYDKNGNFISRETNWQTGENTYTISDGKAYFRVLLNDGTLGNYTYFHSDGNTKKVATIDFVEEYVSENTNDEDYSFLDYPVNSSNFLTGGLDSVGAYNTNDGYVCSKFIPVNGADFLHVEASGKQYWIFWYTASRRFISRSSGWISPTVEDTKVVGKASYARILIMHTTGQTGNYTSTATFMELKDNKIYTKHKKNKAEKRLIFDTDLDLDVDDAVALRCAVWAHRSKKVNLIGITLSVNGSVFDPDDESIKYGNCQYVDTMLFYDGVPDIPIARNSHRSGHNCYYIMNVVKDFYHKVTTNDTLPESVDFYRAALGSLPEGEKTDICVVGYLNSLAELINSSADEYIAKTGLELINEHVGTIYIMGGDYPASTDSAEGNFANGAGAVTNTNTVLTADITNPIIFLGRECGWPVQSGGSLSDMTYDPLYISLKDYHGGTFGPRSSYDPLTLLIACLENDKTGFELTQGTNSINTDSTSAEYGYNTFTANNTGHHYYVSYRYESMQYYVDLIDTIITKKAWT